jgi:membrane fusion protein (multidrug efflux system)
MNKTILGVLAVLGVALAAGGGFWFGQQHSDAPGGSAAVAQGGVGTAGKGSGGSTGPGSPGGGVTVEAAKVALMPLPQGITAVGSLRSDESVTLRPEVAGRISAITFQEGQRVAKGALLVRLDAAVPEAEVQQARANLKLAQTKFDRAVDLAKSNFMSGQAKDEAENNLKVAEAGLQLAEAKLAKMEMRAPFSGMIGLRVVSVGDYVKEGADLVNLESIDTLKVDFRVPEVYLKQVQVGQSLAVTLDAIPGKTFDGKVFALNPLFDAAGRSIVIRATVRNTDTSLRPGMFARVRLFTKEAKDALVVPETALVPTGDEQFVYRVVDGKALRTKVDIGQRRDGIVEVLQGLDPADTIVTAGHLKIRDGTVVKIAGAGRGNGVAAGAAAKSETAPGKAVAPVSPPRS